MNVVKGGLVLNAITNGYEEKSVIISSIISSVVGYPDDDRNVPT